MNSWIDQLIKVIRKPIALLGISFNSRQKLDFFLDS
ncbi:hypothetical protein LRU_00744 [Ligilactobacillus ruminis SPM0211]|uniref:Uncharacterized protein n=1 Tax=Ligilactobacillus ruminis SPM0211 TaxID=1040964 RepID=F7QZ90_9LACO|nr:hypothetical protein LRU_00744 [Ligilactobacillus ruminis SPM0211]